MQIKNKGHKLYILPSLINGGWNEHNSVLKFYNRIYKKFRHYIIDLLTIFFAEKKLRNYQKKLRNFFKK